MQLVNATIKHARNNECLSRIQYLLYKSASSIVYCDKIFYSATENVYKYKYLEKRISLKKIFYRFERARWLKEINMKEEYYKKWKSFYPL